MTRKKTIYEVAVSCTEDYKQRLKDEEFKKYENTLFVGINTEDKVSYSLTADILSDNVKYAILIHKISKLAETNWYSWYEVYTINQQLEVKPKMLDDNFKLFVDYEEHYPNQWMYLQAEGIYHKLIYKCKWPADQQLQVIWDVYQKCLECETAVEAQLLGKFAMADQKILKLEKESANASYKTMLLIAERDQYKSLLDEVKSMVETLKNT